MVAISRKENEKMPKKQKLGNFRQVFWSDRLRYTRLGGDFWQERGSLGCCDR
jgi:hypothetical protein